MHRKYKKYPNYTTIPSFSKQIEGSVGHIESKIYIAELEVGVDYRLDLQR